MRPRVILHNAVSIDGRVSGFTPDIALFYKLAQSWAEDATLAGSETILAAAAAEGAPDETGPGDTRDQPDSTGASPGRGGLLVVPDSRGRVHCWRWLLKQPYWSRGVSLCSAVTPFEHLEYLRSAGVAVLMAGEQRVDLKAALEMLATEYGVRTLRADSGGTLNGALLDADLVDEVSVLLHPYLVGTAEPSFYLSSREPGSGSQVKLRLEALEKPDDDLAWLRYAVVR